MKQDDVLEKLVRDLLDRAEEVGLDSISVTWWIGDKRQEREFDGGRTVIEKVKDGTDEKG